MVDRQRLTIVLAIETGPQAFYAAWLSRMVLREDDLQPVSPQHQNVSPFRAEETTNQMAKSVAQTSDAVLKRMLKRLIKIGRLTVIEADGSVLTCGEPGGALPEVVVKLTNRFTSLKLALRPDLYLGEAYLAGELVIKRGSLWDLLDLCGRNLERRPRRGSGLIPRLGKAAARQLQQFNPVRLSRRNVAHHYDLSHELYRTFLDSDLQYSCAYFPANDSSLDDALLAKKQHIISKLLLEPGHRVLDIGCGWGGLALSLAQA